MIWDFDGIAGRVLVDYGRETHFLFGIGGLFGRLRIQDVGAILREQQWRLAQV